MKPKLIHPVDVSLRRQDKDVPINPAYDQPVGGKRLFLDSQRFDGQISYKVRNAFHAEGLGNAPDASGYVLCYASDWDKLGGGVGDLLEIPGETKCTIVEVRPTAHYKGRHWLYKVFFERGRGDNE